MSNVTLIIDGIELSCSADITPLLRYDAAIMASQELARESRSIQVEVSLESGSSEAIALFAGEGYPHAKQRFNASYHAASLLYDNTTIIEGAATIISAQRETISERDEVLYTIAVSCAGAEWADAAAETTFSKSDIALDRMLNSEDFREGWSDGDAVQFFPVHRDSYTAQPSTVSSDTVMRICGCDDYHPFINVAELLRSIFEGAGYSIESSWLQSSEAQALYMSGSYGSSDSSAAQSSMGFSIAKGSDSAMEANFMGRVYLTVASYGGANVADVDSTSTVEGCYINNGTLAENSSGVLVYTPTTATSVGFEYNLKYTADYRIDTRSTLKSFTQFYLQEGELVKIEVPNRWIDMRGEAIENSFRYSVLIFDHVEGYTYRMLADRADNSGADILGSWSTRLGFVTTPASESYANLRVEYCEEGGSYSAVESDWALYQGLTSEYGSAEFDVTLRSSPIAVSADSSIAFDTLFVQGAESGMSFNLLAGSTMSSYYASFPGAGAQVEFEDVAHHDFMQSKVIESIMQLYNLRILTDERGRKVYIEPAEEIYTEQVDWCDRVVWQSSLSCDDVAAEYYTTTTLGYANSDGVTTRLVSENIFPGHDYPYPPELEPQQSDPNAYSPEYGHWSYSLPSYAAQGATHTSLNQIFAPSQSTTSGVLIVGDRDDLEVAQGYDFSPRIVLKMGEVTLYNNTVIPLVAFHNAEYMQTLCFEDRDDIAGLNRFYQGELTAAASRQYIKLHIRVSPEEIIDMSSPLEGRASFISKYLIEVDGEKVICRLVAIESYDLATQVALCRFITIE